LLGNRNLIVRAVSAIHQDMPREAHGLLDSHVQGWPNCLLWVHAFRSDGVILNLHCIVSKVGLPTDLWVVEVYITS
jgi:hypothetical protein